jgi:hypothetical protein
LAALAFFANSCAVPCWWTAAILASGLHVGALFGLMNSMGVVGGGGSQIYFGLFADIMKSLGYEGRQQWDAAFAAPAALLLASALLWRKSNVAAGFTPAAEEDAIDSTTPQA